MNKRSSIRYSIATVLFSGLLLSGGCFYTGDRATVTLNLGLRGSHALYTPSVFERFLAFITLSVPLAADPPPYPYAVAAVKLTVTGPGMNELVKDLSRAEIDAGRAVFNVPAGKHRVFAVEIYISWEGETPHRDYGGITIADIDPGSNTLAITLGNLPSAPSGFAIVRTENQFAVPLNYVSWNGEDPGSVTGYRLYRSTSETGNYTRIATVPNPGLDLQGAPLTAYFEDYGIDPQIIYWYRVGAYNGFGEGEPGSAFPDNW